MKTRQLASRTHQGLAIENSLLHFAAEQERVLLEAALDRSRAQGQMLAALFTLPGRLIAWRLPDRTRLALEAALPRQGFSFRRVLRNRPERGR
jgi:hypothetical protein